MATATRLLSSLHGHLRHVHARPCSFSTGLRPLSRRLHPILVQSGGIRGFCSAKEQPDTDTADPYQAEVNAFTVELGKRLVDGDRVALSRAITLIESSRLEHNVQAQHLLEFVLNLRSDSLNGNSNGNGNGNGKNRVDSSETGPIGSFRLGIAGPPGAGKSTFIEALGMYLLEKGHRVAVLAVDPSSTRTGGSILGDKTRMHELSRERRAFVRPSPTRGMLGGVAQHTNDVVLLCEAAGYDIVIVETVGLGQSEVLVDSTVDMLMLLVPPAGGDELQGVKKGIMEVADMVVVNKADGDLTAQARHSATDFKHALQLIRKKHADWAPKVKRCSALHRERINEVWAIVNDFRQKMTDNGAIKQKRLHQNDAWLWSQFHDQLKAMVHRDVELKQLAEDLRHELALRTTSPRKAARVLVKSFLLHHGSGK